jgi:hypothetical protein
MNVIGSCAVALRGGLLSFFSLVVFTNYPAIRILVFFGIHTGIILG